MRILGERAYFQADHSSTSYLFYSPKRLDEKTKQLAASFSRRARVGTHTAGYTYNVEGYDLPQGAENKLLAGPFEVMVSESYDWWTLVFAVPYSDESLHRLAPFEEAVGPDDTGIQVESLGSDGKIKIKLYCRLVSGGDWMDTRQDPFETFADKLLDLRDEVTAGEFSGLQLIAARFHPEFEAPQEAPAAVAEWLARNIEP